LHEERSEGCHSACDAVHEDHCPDQELLTFGFPVFSPRLPVLSGLRFDDGKLPRTLFSTAMMTRLALVLAALLLVNDGALAQGPRGPMRMGPLTRGREQFGAPGGNGFGGGMGGGLNGGGNGFRFSVRYIEVT